MLDVYKYIIFNILILLSCKVVTGDPRLTLTEGINGTIKFEFKENLVMTSIVKCFKGTALDIIYRSTSSNNTKFTHHISRQILYLFIKVMEVSDVGYYQCSINDFFLSQWIYVSIKESPIILIDNRQITEDRVFVVANRNVLIQCFSRKPSRYTFSLSFNGEIFDLYKSFTIDDSFKILRCFAPQDQLLLPKNQLDLSIQLYVIEMKVYPLPKRQLKANAETTFKCKITSYVELQQPFWVFNNSSIPGTILSKNSTEIVTTLSLKLSKFNNNQILWCVGDYGKPLLYFSRSLNVTYIPDNITINPPEINTTTSTTNQTFACSADGNPEPRYRWLFQNTEIASDSTLDFKTPLKSEDGGEYFCEAYNSEGNITKGARLYLLVSDSEKSSLGIRSILIISISLILVVIFVLIFIVIWQRRKKLKNVISDNLIISSSYSTERIENIQDVDEQPNNKPDSLKQQPVYAQVNKKNKHTDTKVLNIQQPDNEINASDLTYADLLLEDKPEVIKNKEVINYATINFLAKPNEIENSNVNETVYENTRTEHLI